MHVQIITCLVLYALHFWILFGHKHKMREENTDLPKDRYFSNLLMYVSFLGVLFIHILFLVRKVFILDGIWPIQSEFSTFLDVGSAPMSLPIFIIGTLIFLTGFLIRVWAVRTLGRLFTFEIGIRQGHQIINQGPYEYIRHPSYTGYVLMLIGFGLAVNSWLCAFGLGLGSFLFLSIRILDEESMLKKALAPDYENYMKKTKRWFPYLF